MSKPHDPDQTPERPSSTPDSLDAGMAAASAAPRSSLSAAQRPVLLREAEGDSSHIIKPASDALPPRDQTGDRYQLHGEIARGGMGAVLRGRDVDLGRDLAVKVLLTKYVRHPEAQRRFLEEAQIGGQLQHPGVVPVYDIGHFGERPFFTMKLVKGQTLSAILEQRTSPEAERPRLLAIALQVAQTLAYAHAKGVIHRDLKPANIMVGAFGEVQVMDWGLAKVLPEGGVADEQRAARRQESSANQTVIRTLRSGSAGGSSTRGGAGTSGHETEMGSLLGTPAYMPPEQASGDVNLLDRRCDVFGLGAILCEMLTGQPPYVGRSGEEVRRKAANADLADAHARLAACGAESELVELTKQCLSAEAIDRPRDAQAVVQSLTAYLDGVQERLQTAERERAVAVAREAEQRKRRKVQLALAAAVVALLLVGGAFTLWQSEQAMAGREREARHAEAVAALLTQAEESLRAGDAAKARVALEAARRRSAESAARPHVEQLARWEADLALLQDLDAIDQFRWTWNAADNQLPDRELVAARTLVALRRYGVDPDTVPVDDAAAWVAGSTVAERVVTALDLLLHQENTAGVRALLRKLDGDAFRDAVRDALVAGDRVKLGELAERQDALAQPPGFAAFLSNNRAVFIAKQWRRQLLHSAASRRPGDLGLLMALGDMHRYEQHDAAESVRWFQAAVATAPENYAALINLAEALDRQGDVNGAIACFRRAIELASEVPRAHSALGALLLELGDVSGAVACYRAAVELDPKNVGAHTDLGRALTRQGDLHGAIACWRIAIELTAMPPDASNTDDEEGFQWRRLAANSERLSSELQKLERQVILEDRLQDVREGNYLPTDNREWSDLVELCWYRNLTYTAVRLYTEAFAADPQLADGRWSVDRFNAACFAARAAAGDGEDAARIGQPERERLSQQALEWLRADLQLLDETLQSAAPLWIGVLSGTTDIPSPVLVGDLPRVQRRLRHYERDPDLTSIRDPKALAQLPDEQRRGFIQLWSNVAQLLQQVEDRIKNAQ
jgi:eukaryotic-like serine/threonine-protein kinase